MPMVKLNAFGGIRPKLEKRLLPPSAAQVAENCTLESGAIAPFLAKKTITASPVSNPKSIFPYRGAWLAWAEAVNVCRGPLADDQYERIFYTGDGAPKVRGVVEGVERLFNLGVPKPVTTPSITALQNTIITGSFTMVWGYFYEEPDGRKMQENVNLSDLSMSQPGEVPGGDVSSPTLANSWHGEGPAPTACSAEARLMPFLDGYDVVTGAYLGRAYPSDSTHVGSSDLVVKGWKLTIRIYNRIAGVSGTGSTAVDLQLGKQHPTGGMQYTDCSWVYTFVNLFGEEGPPSDASVLQRIGSTQQAVLALPDNGSTSEGYATLTTKRIYRTVTSNAGTQYQYVGECPIGQVAFTDSSQDIDAGEVCPTIGFHAPDEEFSGLVAMPGGFFAAFKERTVYFSEPNYPHAWPRKYGVSVDQDIVGLGVSGNVLLVVTVAEPYLVTAMDPATTSVAKIPAMQGGASARGIVSMAGVVIYPSSDGVVVAQPGSAIVFSENAIDKATWLAWHPSLMHGTVYDNRVFLFSDNAALIFPIVQDMPVITTTTERPTAAYYDPEADALYLAEGGTIYQWDAAETRLTARWRSREYAFPIPSAPYAARVTAEAYPVTLRLRANDVQVAEVQAAEDTAFWLPTLRDEKHWAFEVAGQARITEVVLTQAMGDLG